MKSLEPDVNTTMIRRTRWDLYVDALAVGQRWWSEERPTQSAGISGGQQAPTTGDTTSRRPRQRLRPPSRVRSIDYDELEQLGKLHADGTLTDEEFAAAKAKILGT